MCTQTPSLLGVYQHLLMDTPELKRAFELLTKRNHYRESQQKFNFGIFMAI